MFQNKRIGLALSGGGYRAAAFHLGVLQKLHELKVLPNVDVLSTISGGSITGAYYCLAKKDYKTFETEMIQRLSTQSVIRRVIFSWVFIRSVLLVLFFLAAAGYLLYTPYPWLSFVALSIFLWVSMKFQFQIFPASKAVEDAYNKIFYEGKTLKDLDDKMPVIAMGSSNIQTGRPFTFAKKKMGDTSYTYAKGQRTEVFLPGDFPIARAVTASSCVPFAFSPVTIAPEFIIGDHKVDPQLIDGGVYDNQGAHKLTHPESEYACDLIIVSDAGNRMFQHTYKNTIALLVRTVDVFMARIKNFQMTKNLYTQGAQRPFHIAYLGLSWDLTRSIQGFINAMVENNVPTATLDAHALKSEWRANPEDHRKDIDAHLSSRVKFKEIMARNLTQDNMKIAQCVSTNLTALSDEQIECLMTHAANMAEIQIRLYLPELIVGETGEAPACENLNSDHGTGN